jgi:hypothetical protein
MATNHPFLCSHINVVADGMEHKKIKQ